MKPEHFLQLQVGATVYVNGTKARVTRAAKQKYTTEAPSIVVQLSSGGTTSAAAEAVEKAPTA